MFFYSDIDIIYFEIETCYNVINNVEFIYFCYGN